MSDSPDTVAKKLKKATTDPTPGITYDPEGRPNVANLLRIMSACHPDPDATPESLALQYVNASTAEFKKELTEVVVQHLSPISQEIARLTSDRHNLQQILHRGNERAREITAPVVRETMEIVGFL
eukprot:GFYU01050951.1.p1 GENE.GFYU01050951.1~~GFYU01050951.1.p1  ORF type:complete len:142 (+),score=34.13 GFYU01050951.1:53-427(+)